MYEDLPRRYPATTTDLAKFVMRHAQVNQTGSTIMTLDRQIDIDRLVQTVRRVLRAEPILGCKMVKRWYRPYWQLREDLETVETCRLIETDDVPSAVNEFLHRTSDVQKDLLFEVLVVRGETDTLCVKYNDVAGDASSCTQLLVMLMDFYDRLGRDPKWWPDPNLNERSIDHISRSFSRDDRKRIVAFIRKQLFQKRDFWKRPATAAKVPNQCFVEHALSADDVNRLALMARQLRASLTMALFAAFGKALYAVFERSGDQGLCINTTVDLRNYVRGDLKKTPHSNMSGPAILNVEGFDKMSLIAATESIRDQFKEQWSERVLGCVGPGMLATFPGYRRFIAAIPFGLLDSAARRKRKRMNASPQLLLSIVNIGDLDRDAIQFGDAVGVDMRATTPIFDAGVFGLVVGRFHHELRFCASVSESAVPRPVLEALMKTFCEVLQEAPHTPPNARTSAPGTTKA